LIAYQGKRLARRYRKRLDAIADEALRAAVAEGYHKLLSYKDEYEVARLLLQSRAKAAEVFDDGFKATFHLAPPMLSRTGPDGRPQKRFFGEGTTWMFRALARFKGLRGTPFDPFGYTSERKMERALIRQYEKDLGELLPHLSANTRDALIAFAKLPLQIRGYGPVKFANEAKAAKQREELKALILAGGAPMSEAAE
jgi:indolepyruvate ferredoxin oxidoreductase